MTPKETVIAIGKRAKDSAADLAVLPTEKKIHALKMIASYLAQNEAEILAANAVDVELATNKNQSKAFIDRLTLNHERIQSMIKGLETIAGLEDPVGRVLEVKTPANGLRIERVSVPIGVIGVIYESRPNVTVDAAALCLMAGNASILRGGSESFNTCKALLKTIHLGLKDAGLPADAVQMLPSSDRTMVAEMLKLDQYIDVLIPRGGKQLIKRIAEESRIPLFKHLAGLCHTYIHEDADYHMALQVLLNAKMRRPGICGATETMLIDESIVVSHLPGILKALDAEGCEIRAEKSIAAQFPFVKEINQEDYDTEYLDAVISVRVVANIEEAISHIRHHGTQHTEAIITTSAKAAEHFFKTVDSAIVMHNTSTQFADGYEFGMGAEIGIATGKLHARGPVGVNELTTFKYLVRGAGQVRP